MKTIGGEKRGEGEGEGEILLEKIKRLVLEY